MVCSAYSAPDFCGAFGMVESECIACKTLSIGAKRVVFYYVTYLVEEHESFPAMGDVVVAVGQREYHEGVGLHQG